jgi:hypothetical protein
MNFPLTYFVVAVATVCVGVCFDRRSQVSRQHPRRDGRIDTGVGSGLRSTLSSFDGSKPLGHMQY